MDKLLNYLSKKMEEFSEWRSGVPWGDYFQVGFYIFVILIIIANAFGGGGENNAYGY